MVHCIMVEEALALFPMFDLNSCNCLNLRLFWSTDKYCHERLWVMMCVPQWNARSGLIAILLRLLNLLNKERLCFDCYSFIYLYLFSSV